MNKTAQQEAALTIIPQHELRFVGPFIRPAVTIMTLKNNTERTMVFKIKTTAPKRYCVRPNIGRIAPHRTTQVEICLQPFMYDQQEKNKHKFMVQSVAVPPEADLSDLNKLWKELEPDQVMDAKLKCVFEMPPMEANAENNSGAGSASVGGNVSANSPAALNSGVVAQSDGNVVSTGMSNMSETTDYDEDLEGKLKTLREIIGELRKENLHLKDQVTRYRSSPATKQINEPYAPVLAEKQIPVFYIAIAIAAAILGLLLGKFLL